MKNLTIQVNGTTISARPDLMNQIKMALDERIQSINNGWDEEDDSQDIVGELEAIMNEIIMYQENSEEAMEGGDGS